MSIPLRRFADDVSASVPGGGKFHSQRLERRLSPVVTTTNLPPTSIPGIGSRLPSPNSHLSSELGTTGGDATHPPHQSNRAGRDGRPVHLLAAFNQACGVVPGQTVVDGKFNEITAFARC